MPPSAPSAELRFVHVRFILESRQKGKKKKNTDARTTRDVRQRQCTTTSSKLNSVVVDDEHPNQLAHNGKYIQLTIDLLASSEDLAKEQKVVCRKSIC